MTPLPLSETPCGGRRLLRAALATAALLVAAVAAAGDKATTDEPIQPIPVKAPQDPARVELGRRLFRDPVLSSNGSVSCATCHPLDRGGADGRAHSVGFSGRVDPRNTPTVYNASLNFRQFWDGRSESLEAQIAEVVESPVEMGSTWARVVQKLGGDPSYRSAFAAAYPEGVTKGSVIDAIATFERTLTTPDSRFDRYLRGNAGALSAVEKAGYVAFKRYGCVACHQGVNVGGNMFQKFGAVRELSRPAGAPAADSGRLALTGIEADRHVFKVPGLRNVALTAPYFHDGSADTLEEAVDVMFRHQLGRSAPVADRDAIVLFLKTLTGAPEGRR